MENILGWRFKIKKAGEGLRFEPVSDFQKIKEKRP